MRAIAASGLAASTTLSPLNIISPLVFPSLSHLLMFLDPFRCFLGPFKSIVLHSDFNSRCPVQTPSNSIHDDGVCLLVYLAHRFSSLFRILPFVVMFSTDLSGLLCKELVFSDPNVSSKSMNSCAKQFSTLFQPPNGKLIFVKGAIPYTLTTEKIQKWRRQNGGACRCEDQEHSRKISSLEKAKVEPVEMVMRRRS